MRISSVTLRTLGLLSLSSSLVACSGKKPSTYLPKETMLDPQTCKGCHPTHYDDWSGSMHAYASDDPVFRAMNKRGQRETNGALGNFCVNCHAPMAVREGATTDGLNLDSVDPKLKGVTCYFCHSVDQVNGAHNDPLHLADDLVMRAAISDPFANNAHASDYSKLLDRNTLDSATLCGSCHDIVTNPGAAIERTFSEWQGSAYSHAPTGTTCGQCHMDQSPQQVAVAQVPNSPLRRIHSHAMPGVDVALTSFANTATQLQLVQSFLDTTLQSALCVEPLGNDTLISTVLDNVAAGHGWPSGSAQDRRAWVEVEAYDADGGIFYQSGVVPDGGSPITSSDPDLWLLRDCMFDGSGSQVQMFWQAASAEGDELPAQATFDPSDRRYYQTHIQRFWPGTGRSLGRVPDHVTMRVQLQPIGLDVLDDLISSGDLDSSLRAMMPTFTVGAQNVALTWTSAAATASYIDQNTGNPVYCVTETNFNVQSDKVPAPVNAHCSP
jgi:hypothetical protein